MSDSEWVSLRRAAELLGVHPATVRNWADKGDIPSRRTPGGHRRFRLADLQRQIRQHSELQPVEVQVIIQNALGETRLQVGEGHLSGAPWYAAMREETRQAMRTQGRALLEELRQYLASGAPDSGLGRAIDMGTKYAVGLIADGLSLPQAVRGFIYFSDFVINSVLTWSELAAPRSPSEWAQLLRQVNTFMNAMLLSIIEYYQED
ncbi:MAG: helix-turn-helix domain-containing protein [Chloroflexi bacterium]|nr:helix-turn-helix domain-containing protein [Chloroflexota bacterium]